MLHQPVKSAAVLSVGVVVLMLALPAPSVGQQPIPASATWQALPNIVPGGATVVVRTRDGGSAKGRVRSLSDSAIVLDGGRVRTIPASAVVTIEGGRMGRPVKEGARIGAGIGMLFALLMAAAVSTPGTCEPDECVTETDAVIGSVVFPAMGAGIGAGIGALIPGKRVLLYSDGAGATLGVAPIAGQGRRGAAVRLAF